MEFSMLILSVFLAFRPFVFGQGDGRLSAQQALENLRQINPYNVASIWRVLTQSVPGQSYPTASSIGDTAFSCAKVQQAGYYADPDAGCQIFRQCLPDGTMRSYICPNQTLFNQIVLVCDWWYNVDCGKSGAYYDYSNPRIYQQNLLFLDDGNGNGGGQPTGGQPGFAKLTEVNRPQPAVVVTVPGVPGAAARQRTASLHFRSNMVNRPVGRSLTSPLMSDYLDEEFMPMTSSSYNAQDDPHQQESDQPVSDNNTHTISISTDNKTLTLHATGIDDLHEISDVSADHHFHPVNKTTQQSLTIVNSRGGAHNATVSQLGQLIVRISAINFTIPKTTMTTPLTQPTTPVTSTPVTTTLAAIAVPRTAPTPAQVVTETVQLTDHGVCSGGKAVDYTASVTLKSGSIFDLVNQPTGKRVRRGIWTQLISIPSDDKFLTAGGGASSSPSPTDAGSASQIHDPAV